MVKKSAEPAKKVAGPVTKQPTRAAASAAPAKAAATKSLPPAARTAKSVAKTAASSRAAAPPAAAKASRAKLAPPTSKDAVKDSASAKQATTTIETVVAPVAAEPVRARPSTKKPPPPPPPALVIPPAKGETKDGIKYTKDFDAKFLTAQYKLLVEARESLTGQALRLEDEANSLIDEEMGDVQFDDESGEGDTMVVERERDLFLSARARQDIEEIESALKRLELGTYGYSVVSFTPISRERLEAIPWATELTEEKVGGIGRR